ncbi:uncharacterized protein [Lolium perenne]|uniref:uncharacterized protein isoform X2 n=1 Tax=Lolium perenne TaxID=4522 RepID=UPI003A98DC7C
MSRSNHRGTPSRTTCSSGLPMWRAFWAPPNQHRVQQAVVGRRPALPILGTGFATIDGNVGMQDPVVKETPALEDQYAVELGAGDGRVQWTCRRLEGAGRRCPGTHRRGGQHRPGTRHRREGRSATS